MEKPSLPQELFQTKEEVVTLQIPGMEKEILGCACREGVMKTGSRLLKRL